MKNLILLFGFITLLAACGNGGSAGNASGATVDSNNFALTDIPGSDYQKAVKKDGDGRLLEEGTLLNGKKYGTWIIYYPEKQVPKTISNFVNGLFNGAYMEFNNRGQIEMLASYKNNALDGQYIKFKNGKPREKAGYKNGKMDGTYISYFDDYKHSDKVQKEFNYKNGELDGTYRFYDEEGNLTLEYEYKNGKKIRGGIVDAKSGK